MLPKKLSILLHTTSIAALSGILLGSTLISPTRAMFEEREVNGPPSAHVKAQHIEQSAWDSFLEQYQNYPTEFHTFLFSDVPGIDGESEDAPINTSKKEDCLKEIITNNKSYDPDNINRFNGNSLLLTQQDIFEDNKISEALKNNVKDIPIGYNVFVPKADVKAVLVHVYGGGSTSRDLFNVSRTLTFGQKPLASDIYNLKKGIMVIKLNLFDLLQLKEKVFQTEMLEDIHALVHSSINKFYQTIKETPSHLHEELVISKMAKIYLTGTSFGGRTVVRHAELYPDTFDGYIAREGVYSASYFSGHEYLSPINFGNDEKISKIQKPILLVHNFDDNHSPVQETLNLYKLLKTAHKDVELCIIPKGNPIPTCGKLPLRMKGHLEPIEPANFKQYIKTMKNFMLENDPNRSIRSQWAAHQYEIYGYKNNIDPTFLEKFLSESFRLYKTHYSGLKRAPMDFENDWVNLYEPLYCTIKFIDDLKPKVTLENLNQIMENIFNHPEFPEELNLLKSMDIFGLKSKDLKELNTSNFYSSFVKFSKMIIAKSNADPHVVNFFNLKDFNERVVGNNVNKEISKIHELILEDSQIVSNALRIHSCPKL